MPNPACRTGCQGMQTNDSCMHPGTTVCTKAGNDLNTTVARIRMALEIAQARAQLTGHCKEVLNLAWPCDSTSAANLPPAQGTSNPRPSLPVSKCRRKKKTTQKTKTLQFLNAEELLRQWRWFPAVWRYCFCFALFEIYLDMLMSMFHLQHREAGTSTCMHFIWLIPQALLKPGGRYLPPLPYITTLVARWQNRQSFSNLSAATRHSLAYQPAPKPGQQARLGAVTTAPSRGLQLLAEAEGRQLRCNTSSQTQNKRLWVTALIWLALHHDIVSLSLSMGDSNRQERTGTEISCLILQH